MDDNEKKEFEEFLKWKAEKAKQQELESASKMPDKTEKKEMDKNVIPSSESRLNGNNLISGVTFAFTIFGIVCIIVLVISFFNKKDNPSKPVAKAEPEEIVVDTVALASSGSAGLKKEKKLGIFLLKQTL